MSFTPVEFIGVCKDRQIGLDNRVIRRLYPRLGDDNLLHSIEVVAKAMPKSPHSVAERPLIDGTLEADFLASVLKNIINGRLVSPDKNVVNFPTSGDERLDTCGNADLGFTKVFTNIFRQMGEDEMHFEQAGCEIFEKGGVPLFIRKGIGHHASAMCLQDVAVEDVPYPAGSIFRIDTEQDLRRKYPYVFRDNLSIISTDTIRKLAFMRLSLFAIAPEDRLVMFKDDYYYDSAYSAMEKVIARSEMSELNEVSRILIDYAKVN